MNQDQLAEKCVFNYKDTAMKFMITWSTHTANRHDVFQTFAAMTDADHETDHPGVTVIGRWHDLAAGTGVAICESDDAAAVQGWGLNWNGAIDVEVRSVLDDQEARDVIRNRLGSE
ncbi:MAG: hypothetical protein CMJ75_18105 [Planctomycetaceae bacterium]|nr:hypothetical protein [Planctomycetaceae bacterium]